MTIGKPHHPDDPDTDILENLIGRSVGRAELDRSTVSAPFVAEEMNAQRKRRILQITQNVVQDINEHVFESKLSREETEKIFGIVYSTLRETAAF